MSELLNNNGNNLVRMTYSTGNWYYMVTDVIFLTTQSKNPQRHWAKLLDIIREKHRDVLQHVRFDYKVGKDGRKRLTDFLNEESLFLVLPYIPSANVKLFKEWLDVLKTPKALEVFPLQDSAGERPLTQ